MLENAAETGPRALGVKRPDLTKHEIICAGQKSPLPN